MVYSFIKCILLCSRLFWKQISGKIKKENIKFYWEVKCCPGPMDDYLKIVCGPSWPPCAKLFGTFVLHYKTVRPMSLIVKTL